MLAWRGDKEQYSTVRENANVWNMTDNIWHYNQNNKQNGCLPLAFSENKGLILTKQTMTYFKAHNIVYFFGSSEFIDKFNLKKTIYLVFC